MQRLLPTLKSSQADELLAKQHNCQPAHPLQIKWPLGLDHILLAFENARSKHLLRHFNVVTDRAAPTFEQRLLGQTGFGTIDPKNIEAVLGTQFTSMYNVSFFRIQYLKLHKLFGIMEAT
jgi:hypothetical protein